MNINLKMEPCPFCGGPDTLKLWSRTKPRYKRRASEGEQRKWRVQCMRCQARGPASDGPYLAVHWWNDASKRAGLPAQEILI